MEHISTWLSGLLAIGLAILFISYDIQRMRKAKTEIRQEQHRYQYTIEIQVLGEKEQIRLYSDWSYENLEEFLSQYRRKDKWGGCLSFPISENEHRVFLESAVEQIYILKTDTKKQGTGKSIFLCEPKGEEKTYGTLKKAFRVGGTNTMEERSRNVETLRKK